MYSKICLTKKNTSLGFVIEFQQKHIEALDCNIHQKTSEKNITKIFEKIRKELASICSLQIMHLEAISVQKAKCEVLIPDNCNFKHQRFEKY